METDQFCYWLRGFFEMTNAKELTPHQVDVIKRHLETVFVNVTHPQESNGDDSKEADSMFVKKEMERRMSQPGVYC